ncbi:MAG TPA: hypothetical protein ENF81_06025 [Thermotogaceae bacterium]|nr:hypothetical protein [Thermotogaceae bacterium]
MGFLGLFDETKRVLGMVKRLSKTREEYMLKAFVADLLWTWKNDQRLLNVTWIKRDGLPFSEDVAKCYESVEIQNVYPKYFAVIEELTKNINITEYTIRALIRKLPEGKPIELEKLKRSWK